MNEVTLTLLVLYVYRLCVKLFFKIQTPSYHYEPLNILFFLQTI